MDQDTQTMPERTLAERARRDPDPGEQARERVDALFSELGTLIAGIRKVDASAVALGAGGEDLLLATRSLNSTARDRDGRP
jgi:hypothetical protein